MKVTVGVTGLPRINETGDTTDLSFDDLQSMITDLQKKFDNLSMKRITQDMVTPSAIKARHVEDAIIKRGIAAKRPTSGSVSCWAYFATDTNVLSVWTGAAWKTTTLG